MAWLTAGCVRRSLRAAREKLRSAATVDEYAEVLESHGRSLPADLHSCRYRSISISTTNLSIITLTLTGQGRDTGLPMSDRLVIFDTTLRDGEQAPGFSMRVEEKVRLARQLEMLGCRHHRGGLPDCLRGRRGGRPAGVRGGQGPCRRGARPVRAWRRGPGRRVHSSGARRGRIHTFIATSDLHLALKLRMSRETCLEMAVAAVTPGPRRSPTTSSFRPKTRREATSIFCAGVVEAVIDAGATTINLPDTVGYSTPDEIGAFFRTVIGRVPNADRAIFSAHCHDDLGLAVANTLAAIAAGVRQVECTINGIGERAGNASLEEIVMVTRGSAGSGSGRQRGIKTPQLFPTSQLLTELTGERVQANKAIVGRNAFAHEAGIHQDGMLKDRRTYEIMRPAGRRACPRPTLVLGKHSGRHAVQKCLERFGLTLSRRDIDEVYRRMVALADVQKHDQ